MSGTDIDYAICLWACYAMPGTDIAFGASSSGRLLPSAEDGEIKDNAPPAWYTLCREEERGDKGVNVNVKGLAMREPLAMPADCCASVTPTPTASPGHGHGLSSLSLSRSQTFETSGSGSEPDSLPRHTH
eukprot:3917474-Rhodomonas_salina.1